MNIFADLALLVAAAGTALSVGTARRRHITKTFFKPSGKHRAATA